MTSATDVRGLGATLFEAATGVAPFAPLDDAEDSAFEDGQLLQLRRAAARVGSLRPRMEPHFSE